MSRFARTWSGRVDHTGLTAQRSDLLVRLGFLMAQRDKSGPFSLEIDTVCSGLGVLTNNR